MCSRSVSVGDGGRMVDESFFPGDARWPLTSYPEWVSRCERNREASTLAVGALVRPNFSDPAERRTHPIGRISRIHYSAKRWCADVIWEGATGEKECETVPRMVLTDELGGI